MNRFLTEITKSIARLRDIISSRDLIPKLVSLLLAVLLWAYIGSTRLAEYEYRIPVELKNLPSTLVVSKINLSGVTVQFNGKKEDFANFNLKNVKAVVNLENAKEGKDQRFPVAILRSELPESIRITSSRKYLVLDIERRLYKKVPVEVAFGDNLKEGVVAGVVSILPQMVTVSGRESAVKNISLVTTELINGIRDAGRFEKEIPIDRSLYRDIEVIPSAVRVQYVAFAVDGLHKLEVPLAVKNIRDGVMAEPSKRKVLLFVKTLPGQNLSADDCEAYVDSGKLEYAGDENKIIETVLKVNAGLKVPKEGAMVMMIVPAQVKVRIRNQ